MSKFGVFVAVFMMAFLVILAGAAPGPVVSGPQVGQKVPGPFRPLHATGPDAGNRVCLYCKNGANPVAMVFAREVSAPLVTLLKKLDAATAAHADCRMGSFVVFLNAAPDLPGTLRDIAEKEGIKTTILSTDAPAGPASYKISAEADVTVILYTHYAVKANHALRKGELNEKTTAAIVDDLAKILPTE